MKTQYKIVDSNMNVYDSGISSFKTACDKADKLKLKGIDIILVRVTEEVINYYNEDKWYTISQTLPDNYTLTLGINDRKRYELIGNGWTVDVIAHILKQIGKKWI